MKNRRDFFRNTLGLGAMFAAAPRLFAAPHESGAGMDMKHMSHATEHGSGLNATVETPDIPHLPWRMDGSIKEFHLIAEPVKQEIVPGQTTVGELKMKVLNVVYVTDGQEQVEECVLCRMGVHVEGLHERPVSHF